MSAISKWNLAAAVTGILSMGDRAVTDGIDGMVDLDDLSVLENEFKAETAEDAVERREGPFMPGHFLNPNFIDWLKTRCTA